MTKKHFQALADAIHASIGQTAQLIQDNTTADEDQALFIAGQIGWEYAARIADVCRKTNSRFDAIRFTRACRIPRPAAEE